MTEPRRRFKTLSVNEILPKVVTPLLKSHDVKGASILYDWHKIVDKKLATLTKPEKIIYKRGSVAGGVLHLNVSPSIALEVQHTQGQIVDRINTHFGYQCVSALKLKQVHIEVKVETVKELSPKQREEISGKVSGIEDEKMHDALRGLGEAIEMA